MTFRFIRHPAGLAAAALSLLSGSGAAAQSRLDPVSATSAFEHAQSLCEADQGRAWGVSLCGAMLVADPATRAFISNMDGVDAPLERDGEVFKGRLAQGDQVRAYARSFAYYTGPAYGVLLDEVSPDWKKTWDRREGLPSRLAKTLGLEIPSDDEAFAASGLRYGAAAIQAEEAARALEQSARIATLRAALVEGSVLIAPVSGANFSFDPNTVTPLPPEETVYGVIRAAADWGVLEVHDAALLSTDWSRLTVEHAGAVRTDDGLKGRGWTLTLRPGWELTPGPRGGDWTIGRRP
jgi:hypothetical protein